MEARGKEIAKIWANNIVSERKVAFIVLFFSFSLFIPFYIWQSIVNDLPWFLWILLIILIGVLLHLIITVGFGLIKKPIILYENAILIRDRKADQYMKVKLILIYFKDIKDITISYQGSWITFKISLNDDKKYPVAVDDYKDFNLIVNTINASIGKILIEPL